jgi:hypothetical protein
MKTEEIKGEFYKLTDKQISDFYDYVAYYKKYFGLTDWEIFCYADEMDGCFGHSDWEVKHKKATIRVNINIPADWLAQFNLKRLAKHEVAHILLAEMDDELRCSEYDNCRIVEAVIHRICDLPEEEK